MKEAIHQKKVAYKKICENRSENDMAGYKNIKNRTKKVVTNSMRKELNEKQNNIFTQVKFMENRKR